MKPGSYASIRTRRGPGGSEEFVVIEHMVNAVERERGVAKTFAAAEELKDKLETAQRHEEAARTGR